VTPPLPLVGAHVSAAGGVARAEQRAREIGAAVAQIFSGSPRGWQAGRPTVADCDAARAADAVPLVLHASYLVNLASSDAELARRSATRLAADLAAGRDLRAAGVVLHPGSHRGAGLEAVLGRLVDRLRQAVDGVEGAVPLLLENTAGAGGTIGRSLEEWARLREAIDRPGGVGVCLDTQHLWASGLTWSDEETTDRLVRAIVAAVGRPAVVHLNDSAVEAKSARDRHANLGSGTIGAERLGLMVGHPALAEALVVLEVPGDGHGPRAEDVAVAREVVAKGRARWEATGGL